MAKSLALASRAVLEPLWDKGSVLGSKPPFALRRERFVDLCAFPFHRLHAVRSERLPRLTEDLVGPSRFSNRREEPAVVQQEVPLRAKGSIESRGVSVRADSPRGLQMLQGDLEPGIRVSDITPSREQHPLRPGHRAHRSGRALLGSRGDRLTQILLCGFDVVTKETESCHPREPRDSGLPECGLGKSVLTKERGQ